MIAAKDLGVYIEAWLLSIISTVLAVSWPVGEYLAFQVPDITAYIASCIFLGALLGGLFWLANRLLAMKTLPPVVTPPAIEKS